VADVPGVPRVESSASEGITVPFGFGGKWIKTHGKVIASRDIGGNRKEWVVEVTPQDGPPFRETIKWPFNDHGFWPVSVGETIRIEYEAKSHEVRWDKDDPATNLYARKPADERAQEQQAFADALAGKTPAPGPGGLDPMLAELQQQAAALEAALRSAPASSGVPADAQPMAGAPGLVHPAPSAADAALANDPHALNFQFNAGGQPAAGEVAEVVSGVASGQLRTIRGSAAELLATGIRGVAEVTTASPLGKTVRDVNPYADPSRLDDPMWLFTVVVTVPGQEPQPAVFGHRVPLAKLAQVGPGMRLAVAVDPADPHNRVAIDWDQSPLG
jgi:hypothetical protein